MAGVEMTAPPTPNMPESTPVKKPAISVRTTVTASDIAGDTTEGPPVPLPACRPTSASAASTSR